MVADSPILDRLELELTFSAETCEGEECVIDDRAKMRPSEYVQQKFLTFTRDVPITVSSLQTRRIVRR